MFGISGFKLLIIVLAALIFIGPEKLPEIGRTLGKMLQMFNAAKADMEQMMKGDILGVNETTSSLAGKTVTPPSQTVASTLYSKDGDEEGEEEE